MHDLGRALVILGALIAITGLAVLLAGKLNLPLGRLPGDFFWRSKSGNSSVYFPVATCLVISILISLIFWIVSAIRK